MNAGRIAIIGVGLMQLYLLPGVMADETVDAVKLSYQEFEEGVEPYRVSYTVSGKFVRIDDESDSSGYIVYDIGKNTIYSISHYDQSILVIPEYKAADFKPGFEIAVDYQALENAPGIAGKKVYNYEVKAITSLTSETCMSVQLVPGLMPDVAETLQKFQKLVSGQQAATLEKTPEEFRTPCYLVGQVYNRGEYYSKGLPIQEWHSNERRRQLLNFEDARVDVSIFDIPADYRQYSLFDQE